MSVAPGNTWRLSRPRSFARPSVLALGALLAACGGVAGSEADVREGMAGSGSSEPAAQHAVHAARPAEPEGREGPAPEAPEGSTPAASEGAAGQPGVGDERPAHGVPVVDAAPVTPVQTPPEPSPPPTGELELPRPITPTPKDVVVPPDGCRFEYLGDWVRCENAGWPNVIRTDAADLVTCMQQCLERADCTAVTDYLWLGLHELQSPELGCWLYVSTCDAPAFVAWGEEDAGREYRRACAE